MEKFASWNDETFIFKSSKRDLLLTGQRVVIADDDLKRIAGKFLGVQAVLVEGFQRAEEGNVQLALFQHPQQLLGAVFIGVEVGHQLGPHQHRGERGEVVVADNWRQAKANPGRLGPCNFFPGHPEFVKDDRDVVGKLLARWCDVQLLMNVVPDEKGTAKVLF